MTRNIPNYERIALTVLKHGEVCRTPYVTSFSLNGWLLQTRREGLLMRRPFDRQRVVWPWSAHFAQAIASVING
jgi:hypothetical protein